MSPVVFNLHDAITIDREDKSKYCVDVTDSISVLGESNFHLLLAFSLHSPRTVDFHSHSIQFEWYFTSSFTHMFHAPVLFFFFLFSLSGGVARALGVSKLIKAVREDKCRESFKCGNRRNSSEKVHFNIY